MHVRTRYWPWLAAGAAAIAVAFGGVGSWGATVPLASAVIAKGQVTVDTNRKQIQHLEGGIVAAINVRNGDIVKPGDILIHLDDTRAKASLAIIAVAFREELAKEARLIAERDEKEFIEWSEALHRTAADPDVIALMSSQTAIFESRRDTLRGEIEILSEKVKQLEDEIEGLMAQKGAAEKQTGFIEEELQGLIELFRKGQTTKPRILELQREAAKLEGEHGNFISKVALARKAIGETKLEIIQKQKAFRTEVVSALRDVQAKLNDLSERHVAALDTLNRIEIRSPVAGKVVGLAVHARYSVIRPGDTIMEIVPSTDQLLVEVKFDPQDIDNVAVGQKSDVRILAFKQRTTPSLNGAVTYVSADALTNPQNGATYYVARISVPEAELKRLEGQDLQPGMPAEVMIQTGSRTAVAYLMQPLKDSVNRAWREP